MFENWQKLVSTEKIFILFLRISILNGLVWVEAVFNGTLGLVEITVDGSVSFGPNGFSLVPYGF